MYRLSGRAARLRDGGAAPAVGGAGAAPADGRRAVARETERDARGDGRVPV
jgi:hypothetical protein